MSESEKKKSKTSAEERAKSYELIEITREMREAMEAAVENNKRPPCDEVEAPREEGTNFREYDQSQSFWIPVNKKSFLDGKHPAAVLDAIVERLDLSEVYADYSNEGNPPFHPKMMLKILFYAYFCGVMTARTMWDAVVNRADFIYLAAGQVPNFRTINSFRLRHRERLPDLFTQIVVLCKELGMIGFEFMAVDGQKLRANADFRKSRNLEGLRKDYEKLKRGVEHLLAKEVNEHVTSEKKKNRLEKIEKKLAKMEQLIEQLENSKDKKKKVNMTDPDATYLTHKNRVGLPSYNHQTARDGKYGVATSVQTTQSNDAPEDLLTLVDQSIANTGERHDTVAADCGFANYDTYEKCENRPEDFYVPDRRLVQAQKAKKGGKQAPKYPIEVFLRDDGRHTCPAGHLMKFHQQKRTKDGGTANVYAGTHCKACPLRGKCTDGKRRYIEIDTRMPIRDRMRAKLDTDKGREVYRRRQGVVESVHGDDQKNKGWTQHHLRGIEKARLEFMLIRTVTNIALIIKHRPEEVLQSNAA